MGDEGGFGSGVFCTQRATEPTSHDQYIYQLTLYLDYTYHCQATHGYALYLDYDFEWSIFALLGARAAFKTICTGMNSNDWDSKGELFRSH